MLLNCRCFSCNCHSLLAGRSCHYVTWCLLLVFTCCSVIFFSKPIKYNVKIEFASLQDTLIVNAENPLGSQVKNAALLIFSAWLDTRLPQEVQLVGILNSRKANLDHNLICEFKKLQHLQRNDSNSPIAFDVPASGIRHIHFSHRGSVQVFCPARPDLLHGDWLVSISFDIGFRNRMKPMTIKKIVIKPGRRLFAICVPPFYQKFDSYHKLIEMIELNRLFGAQHFFLYDNDSGPNLQKVLDYYAKHTDFVRVVPWKFDVGEMGVTVAGQMSSLADCKYRVMTEFEYMIATDVDEFIVPRAFKTWLPFDGMFKETNASQLVFANYFYHPDANNSKSTDGADLKENLASLTSSTRWNTSSSFSENSMDRTKVIARSECILDHYVHFVQRVLPVAECAGLETVLIKDTMGVGHLHHYRDGLPNNFQKSDCTVVVDRFLPETYEADLLKAVEKVFKEMRKLGITFGNTTSL